jgi:hypothetical protein
MYSPEVRNRVISALLGEARGEGLSGMQAVAEVMRNRVGSNRYPNELGAVVNQPAQFQDFHYGTPELRQKAGSIFDLVFNPEYQGNLAGGATHYWAPQGMPGGKDPYWAAQEQRQQNAKRHRLGGHVFLSPGEPNPERFGQVQPNPVQPDLPRGPFTANAYASMDMPTSQFRQAPRSTDVPNPAVRGAPSSTNAVVPMLRNSPSSNAVPVQMTRPPPTGAMGVDFPAVPPQVAPNPVQPNLQQPRPTGDPFLPVANAPRPTLPTGAPALTGDTSNAFAGGDISKTPFDLHSILASHQDAGHIDNLDTDFRSSIARMISSAPPEIREHLGIMSGYRDVEHQRRLWNAALRKYGSAEKARKWVAPPGKSFHNKGSAVDLTYGNDAAREWVHANAEKYGLHFPLGNENWHIEPMGSRSGKTSRIANNQVQSHDPHSTPPAGGKLTGGNKVASASAKGRGNTGKGFFANLFGGGGGGKNPLGGMGGIFSAMADDSGGFEPLPRLNVPQNSLMAASVAPTVMPLRRRMA